MAFLGLTASFQKMIYRLFAVNIEFNHAGVNFYRDNADVKRQRR